MTVFRKRAPGRFEMCANSEHLVAETPKSLLGGSYNREIKRYSLHPTLYSTTDYLA